MILWILDHPVADNNFIPFNNELSHIGEGAGDAVESNICLLYLILATTESENRGRGG